MAKLKHQDKLDREMRCLRYDALFEQTNSTCGRLKVGCGVLLVAPDGEPIVKRFACNGPRVPCVSDEPGKCGHEHAEVRAIRALRETDSYRNHRHRCTLYAFVTHSPCEACARILLEERVSVLVYDHDYRDPAGLNLLRLQGVIVERRDPALGSRYMLDFCGNKRR